MRNGYLILYVCQLLYPGDGKMVLIIGDTFYNVLPDTNVQLITGKQFVFCLIVHQEKGALINT